MPGYTVQVGVKHYPVDVPKDRYGKQVVDWSAVPVSPVDELVSVQPAGQTESGRTEFRDQVTSVWVLFTQPGVDIDLSQRDRVVWGAAELDCVSVDRWPHPVIVGGVHHVEARLEKVSG